jgi:hypothetical protein
VIFNGNTAQQYTDPNSDPFYNVTMNQSPASTLTLNNRMDIANQLTLTAGRIVTGATLEVRVTNAATTAVTPGNLNSYVQGRLRRYIGGTGAYDFPVGTDSYQRANVNFTAAPGVHNLLAWFNDWGGPAPTPPNPTAECGAQYHTCPMLNNGYWTINAYANDLTTQLTPSGTYTMTLYNTAFTTCPGAAQFGVLKQNPPGNWFIQNPGCHANANAAMVQRPGMSGFSNFGTGQSIQPLPVYLTQWEGYVRADDAHVLQWDVVEEGIRVSSFVVEVGSTPTSLQAWRTYSSDVRQAVRENPPGGSSFYRLRIHLADGGELHSSILELQRQVSPQRISNLEAFPNPTDGTLTVHFWAASEEEVRIELLNALGQVVIEEKVTPTATGSVEQVLSLGALPAGPYLLRVVQGSELQTKVIQRR